jgi:phosphopentomutase
VAVFATWNTFKDIFNQKRSRLATLRVGWDLPFPDPAATPREQLMNRLYRETTRLDDEDVYDAFLQVPLLDYLDTGRPRLLFVGYGETDNWGHAGRYDLLLESAHGFDRYVEQLWTKLQALPEYRDQTTFILTADHGRGSGPEDWKEHGVDQKGSENIWIAVMGPDTPPLGERSNIARVTQSQIPATIAALLGTDYSVANPAAGKPIDAVLPAAVPAR